MSNNNENNNNNDNNENNNNKPLLKQSNSLPNLKKNYETLNKMVKKSGNNISLIESKYKQNKELYYSKKGYLYTSKKNKDVFELAQNQARKKALDQLSILQEKSILLKELIARINLKLKEEKMDKEELKAGILGTGIKKSAKRLSAEKKVQDVKDLLEKAEFVKTQIKERIKNATKLTKKNYYLWA